MKVELLNRTSKEELEHIIHMVASSGRLSQYDGNVFEVLADNGEAEGDPKKIFEADLKTIRNITGMGHKSIIEHDYLVFAISDVTPIVEQTIIGNRLTSFTIKSRRYVDFANAGFFVPEFRNVDYSIHMENKELKNKYRKHMRYLFKEYSAMIEGGISKEDARFILPYSFYSNIVMGLDARELEKMIVYLLYGEVSKIAELKDFGEKLFAIVKKQVPYLTRNIEKYKNRVNSYNFEDVLYKHMPSIEIIDAPELIDYTGSDYTALELGIMYKTQCGYDDARRIIEEIEKEEPDFKAKMINEIIHREEARELEHISFTFQIPISLSSLTHLTRHRMHSLMVPSFVPLWNFDNFIVPDTIKNSKFIERYKKAIATNKAVMEEFKRAGVIDEDLIYFYLGAQMCNVVTTMNARSLIWFSRMRCCNRAQWEIRDIAKVMVSEARKIVPLVGRGFGPSCVVDHICNEKFKSCGLIKKILEKENE